MGTLVFYNWPIDADATQAPWSLRIFFEGASVARVRVIRHQEGSANSASSGPIILFVDVQQCRHGSAAVLGEFARAWSCRGDLSACEWVPGARLPAVVDEQNLGWLTSQRAENLLAASRRCADLVQARTESTTTKRRARDTLRELDFAIQEVKRARLETDDEFDKSDAINAVFMQRHLPRQLVSQFLASGATREAWVSAPEWLTDTSPVQRLSRLVPGLNDPTMTLRDGVGVVKTHLRSLALFELKHGCASCIRPGVLAPKKKPGKEPPKPGNMTRILFNKGPRPEDGRYGKYSFIWIGHADIVRAAMENDSMRTLFSQGQIRLLTTLTPDGRRVGVSPKLTMNA